MPSEEDAHPSRSDPHAGHFYEIRTQPRRGPRIKGQAERTGITVGEMIKGSMGSIGETEIIVR